jgi:hypothetical protein
MQPLRVVAALRGSCWQATRQRRGQRSLNLQGARRPWWQRGLRHLGQPLQGQVRTLLPAMPP